MSGIPCLARGRLVGDEQIFLPNGVLGVSALFRFFRVTGHEGTRNMRRLLIFVLLTIGLMLPAASAQAATTIQRDIPFEATIEACGETITLSGTLIGIFTEQPLDGGGFLLTFHFQPQGVAGTSSSGIVYHATGLTRDTTVFVPSGGLTDTFVNRFHIVGTSGASTFYVKETSHLTVTPDGKISVSVDNFSMECV
jgi:hypothetical protein